MRATLRSSSSASDSSDDYFNQQRKQIKAKINPQRDTPVPIATEEEEVIQERRDWDDDMEEFDKLMEKSVHEAQRLQAEEAEKARLEQERLRIERLKRQEELIREEQEKKRKERDELMEKLKRQDEERKKRKREDKEKKDREREKQRKIEEELYYKAQEEQDRVKAIEDKAKAEEEGKKREKVESERRKDNFEKSIRKIWNGSDIPCLFDPKIAYSKMLYSLPVDLERKIQNNEQSYEDVKLRRYKTLVVPIDGLLSNSTGKPMIELISYFLRYSTLK